MNWFTIMDIVMLVIALLWLIFVLGACKVAGDSDEITEQIYRNEMEKRDECHE